MATKLVAYFSATGTTAIVAEKLASRLEADIFEIIPVDKYTVEDLNWRNKKSRCYVEMKDGDYSVSVENLVAEVVVGNTVQIWFDDSVIESYPYQLNQAYRIVKK